jgi:hypothetical protein
MRDVSYCELPPSWVYEHEWPEQHVPAALPETDLERIIQAIYELRATMILTTCVSMPIVVILLLVIATKK